MALLGFGIWLVADQSSVITLLRLADHETIRVSYKSCQLSRVQINFTIFAGIWIKRHRDRATGLCPYSNGSIRFCHLVPWLLWDTKRVKNSSWSCKFMPNYFDEIFKTSLD